MTRRLRTTDLLSRRTRAVGRPLYIVIEVGRLDATASRDGGVDCVAFDPRPIFGGKVVIQAKRYKGTVGVSAVRDLFGHGPQ